MKKKLFLIIIFIISFKSIIWSENDPNNTEPLNEQNLKILSDNEIKIIDEVIKHITTYELEKTMGDGNFQIYMINPFYVSIPFTQNKYEEGLRSSFNYLKKEFMIEDNIILSFIENNIIKREVDKNVKFKSDVFWRGDRPNKSFIVMLFSSIGFNQNETEALVHVVVDLPNFKFSEYIYLQKENGEWKFRKCISSWMT
jgi:hypothetical protein